MQGMQTMIGKPRASVAMGDYDRTRPLLDGTVQIDGAEPVFMTLSPEEMFFRAFRYQDFDISELSFSSYAVNDAFLRHHHPQGLSKRRLSIEDVFHPATFETAGI
jgi:hypothetical protein